MEMTIESIKLYDSAEALSIILLHFYYRDWPLLSA